MVRGVLYGFQKAIRPNNHLVAILHLEHDKPAVWLTGNRESESFKGHVFSVDFGHIDFVRDFHIAPSLINHLSSSSGFISSVSDGHTPDSQHSANLRKSRI